MQFNKLHLAVAVALTTFIAGQSHAQANLRGTAIPPGKYYIQSALENGKSTLGAWDLKGKNPKVALGMEISVWELSDRAGDRQYSFKPVSHPNGSSYYEILVSNIGDARVGVVKGQKKSFLKGKEEIKKGALLIEKAASADNQLFSFEHIANGAFAIRTFDGRALKISSPKNGEEVVASSKVDPAGDLSARWVLINVDTNKVFVP